MDLHRAPRKQNHLPSTHDLPLKDERTQVRADENADDDVAVVVHSQATLESATCAYSRGRHNLGHLQHNKVRNCKLKHVQKRSYGLLKYGRTEAS